MASENETMAEIVKRMDDRANQLHLTAFNNSTEDLLRVTLHNFILEVGNYAHEIEAAHGREVDAILKDRDEMYKSEQETIAKTNAWFEEYRTLKREVAELRECLNEALEIACDGCRFAVWKNRKFVKCKRHKNWKCPFGTERWRKALESEK